VSATIGVGVGRLARDCVQFGLLCIGIALLFFSPGAYSGLRGRLGFWLLIGSLFFEWVLAVQEPHRGRKIAAVGIAVVISLALIGIMIYGATLSND